MDRAHYYKNLIKHYGSATLIDVLHSPFVFALYNNCIKKKSIPALPGHALNATSYFRKRADEVILKYALCYKTSQNYLTGSAERSNIAYGLHVLQVPFADYLPSTPCDLIYFEIIPDAADLKPLFKNMHNNSVIVVRDLYRFKKNTDKWEAIKQLPEVTVTVDLFYTGFIFIRNEQRRQDFRLRLF